MRKAGLTALLAVTLSGCTADYATQSNAPVLLRITGISPAVVDSDVSVDGVIEPDLATMGLAVRSTNPNVTVPQVALAVFMERYEIRYVRSDGRATEGVDVPYRITGAMNGVIDAQTSGSTEFTIEVVRRQAKLEPPLRNLVGGGGAIVVTMFAEITVFGRTTAGQVVQTSARVQIDFGDYS